jgi:WD40 repeat protein
MPIPILPILQDKLKAKASPLDRLDPRLIPFEDRLAGQPRELVAVIGKRRPDHAGPSMAFAPDGRTIALGCDDKTVQLWDLGEERPQQRLVIRGLPGVAWKLAWSPDGKRLALSFADNTIRLWDVGGAAPHEWAKLSGPPDNDWIIDELKQTRDEFTGYALENLAPEVAFTPDGKNLVACRYHLRMWDVRGKAPRERALPPRKSEGRDRRGVPSGDRKLLWAISPDGQKLVVANWNKPDGLVLWELGGDSLVERELPSPFAPSFLGFTAGKLMLVSERVKQPAAVAGDVGQNEPEPARRATVTFWDLSQNKLERKVRLERHSDWFHNFVPGKYLRPAFATSSQMLAVPCYFSANSGLQTLSAKNALQIFGQRILLAKHEYRWVGQPPVLKSVAVVKEWKGPEKLRAPGFVTVWSTATGQQVFEPHLPDCFWSLAFAPDGRHLATRNNDGTIYILRLWDDGEAERSLVRYDAAVRQDPNNRDALAGRGQLFLRQSEPGGPAVGLGGELRRFQVYLPEAQSVAFSADGRRALSATRDGGFRLWDVNRAQEIRKCGGQARLEAQIACQAIGSLGAGPYVGPRLPVALGIASLNAATPPSLALTPDGRRALTVGGDHRLRLWDLENGKELAQLQGHTASVSAIVFSDDGQVALSAGRDSTVRVWDLATGKERAVFRGHRGPVRCVGLSRDGRLAASGGDDGILRLWDPEKGRELSTLKGHEGAITCLAFAGDGRRVLTGGEDKTVRLWDTGTGLLLARFAGHTDRVEAVALSADGRLALSGSQVGAGRIIGDRLVSTDGRVPDSGSGEGILCLWDTTTEKVIRGFRVPGGPIRKLALSADGRQALSASQDGTVRVWQLPLNQAQALADLTAVIQLDPKSAPAHVQRGRCYLREGKVHEALADIEHALRLDAGCQDAYFYRAVIHRLQQKHGQTEQTHHIAQAIVSQAVAPPGAGAPVWPQAFLALKLTLQDQALADLTRVINRDPGNARALYERGLLWSEKGDYAQAKRDLEKALGLDPKLGNGAVP